MTVALLSLSTPAMGPRVFAPAGLNLTSGSHLLQATVYGYLLTVPFKLEGEILLKIL